MGQSPFFHLGIVILSNPVTSHTAPVNPIGAEWRMDYPSIASAHPSDQDETTVWLEF
jgi:hypothetical protein